MGTSTQFDARLVGSDPPTDLAVLRIDAPPEMLAPAAIAPSSALRVGQYVYAIGNPSGLNKTLTSGVVSGLNRSIPSPTGQRIPGVVQTDASISAGNSGGPLLNSSGQVVGINVATFTRSGSVCVCVCLGSCVHVGRRGMVWSAYILYDFPMPRAEVVVSTLHCHLIWFGEWCPT